MVPVLSGRSARRRGDRRRLDRSRSRIFSRRSKTSRAERAERPIRTQASSREQQPFDSTSPPEKPHLSGSRLGIHSPAAAGASERRLALRLRRRPARTTGGGAPCSTIVGSTRGCSATRTGRRLKGADAIAALADPFILLADQCDLQALHRPDRTRVPKRSHPGVVRSRPSSRFAGAHDLFFALRTGAHMRTSGRTRVGSPPWRFEQNAAAVGMVGDFLREA